MKDILHRKLGMKRLTPLDALFLEQGTESGACRSINRDAANPPRLGGKQV
jgi:hypothetical protein